MRLDFDLSDCMLGLNKKISNQFANETTPEQTVMIEALACQSGIRTVMIGALGCQSIKPP